LTPMLTPGNPMPTLTWAMAETDPNRRHSAINAERIFESSKSRIFRAGPEYSVSYRTYQGNSPGKLNRCRVVQ